MKILITGGVGFIGKHLVEAYIKAGHKVVVVDNLTTGSKTGLNKKAVFYKSDIRQSSLISKIIKKENPAVLSHHAAIAEVSKSLLDPIPTMDVNVVGTVNLLNEFAKSKAKNKKVIFASSGGAGYGNPITIPTAENAPLEPTSPYGLSKVLGEEIVRFYASQHKMTYTIFRYGNVYGPGQNPKGEAGVVAIFAGIISAGGIPTIYGNGKKTRDYVHVSDVVAANLAALRKGRNEIINIATGIETSDDEVLQAVTSALQSNIKPHYAPHRMGEVKRIALDIKKAKKVLGWVPQVSFKEGVTKTLKSE